MHKSRYVVTNQDGGWQIRNVHHYVAATFPSKVQALCAAIELAEKDGGRGHAPEVLVRHEDDRFITGGCTEKIYIRTRPPVRRARNSPAAVALKVNALRCENQSDRALL